MLAAALVALAGLVACERPRDVAVRVSIPGPDSVETPVTGVGLIALPYDRDSVLAALEASATSPRPDTAALDSLFRAFRVPFVSYTGTIQRTERLRDSLDLLRTRLDSLPAKHSRVPGALRPVLATRRLADRGAEADRAGPPGPRSGPRRFHRPQRKPAGQDPELGR